MASDAVEIFVREARDYCTFVESASTFPLANRLNIARMRLLMLYTAALSLPAIEPGEIDAGPSPDVPKDWPGFGEKDFYWEVFDPYEQAEPVAGSLSDDLLDIYRDLQRGLALWDAAHRQYALWEWRFHRDVHWGDHAVDALRALHRACHPSTGDA
ncbi:MAG: DUF5063 domain-containing protein [Kofleriaceae bacterium]